MISVVFRFGSRPAFGLLILIRSASTSTKEEYRCLPKRCFLSSRYWLSALLLSGIGVSAFVSMQATLILLSTPDAARGRVLGILFIVIGAQPLGSLLVGIAAEFLGPGEALRAVAVGGFVLTGLWVIGAKQMRQL